MKKDERRIIQVNPGVAQAPGYLPNILVVGRTLPEAWERSVTAAWEQGTRIPTDYDKKTDPKSRDCAATISVLDPLTEPRISLPALQALPIDLGKYVLEVTEGAHDDWQDPEEGKWSYTYHGRLRAYPGDHGVLIDQISYIVEELARAPYSRRAQGITWIPQVDPGTKDPPCLQRFWCRVMDDDKLVMRINIRSNDAFKAAFWNMYAFVEFQRIIAAMLSGRLDRTIQVGQYDHVADSYHIYGSYFDEFERFLQSVKDRPFEERVWRSDDPDVARMLNEEARAAIQKEKETGRKGVTY